MNKQQFAFQFGFAVILCTSLLGAPIRANAGGTNDFAPRPDGVPARPETFPARGGTSPRIALPFRNKGVKVTTGANGKVIITVTPAIQRSINEKATTIFTNQRVVAGRQITTRNSIIARVMVGRDNPTNAQTQLITNAQTELTNSLSELGVSTNNIKILTEKISSLLVVRTQNIDGNDGIYLICQSTNSSRVRNTSYGIASSTKYFHVFKIERHNQH